MWEIGRIYSVETGISGNSKIYEIKHIVDFVFSKLKLLVGLNGSWLLYLFFYFFGFFKVTKLTTKKWKPVFKFFSCLSPPKTYLCIMNFKMHAFYILCHNYRLQILTLIKDLWEIISKYCLPCAHACVHTHTDTHIKCASGRCVRVISLYWLSYLISKIRLFSIFIEIKQYLKGVL